MKSLDDWLVINVNMQNGDSNIVLDASIRYNESICRVWRRFENYIVKKTNIGFEVIITLFGW